MWNIKLLLWTSFEGFYDDTNIKWLASSIHQLNFKPESYEIPSHTPGETSPLDSLHIRRGSLELLAYAIDNIPPWGASNSRKLG